MLSQSDLQTWQNLNIKDICGCGYINNSFNHCAHFVAHVLGYEFGYTCKQATGKGSPGATLRVNEIFNECRDVGKWDSLPAGTVSCLAFVTAAGHVNLAAGRMSDHPQKHIGIYCNGTIWHYSNSRKKVWTATPNDFKHHYPGADITVYYGEFPV